VTTTLAPPELQSFLSLHRTCVQAAAIESNQGNCSAAGQGSHRACCVL
jgi:hypothetical protein